MKNKATNPGTPPRASPAISGLSKTAFLARDVFGRTLLHLCVLCNDPVAFGQVLRHPHSLALLHATDHENGWNILHYIFFHKRLRCLCVLVDYLQQGSHVAVAGVLAELLKRKDRGRSPPMALLHNDAKDLFWIPQYLNEKDEWHLVRRFDHFPRRIAHDWWHGPRGGSDLFVFGVNSNNNLGVGDSRDRSVPTRVAVPQKPRGALRDVLVRPRVCLYHVSKYHSVLVTTGGDVYTCGIGSRGRLGHGSTNSCFAFRPVAFAQAVNVAAVAVSNSHNLALTSENEIYAWGLNSFSQLGVESSATSFRNVTSDAYEYSPKLVHTGDLRRNKSPILGVCCSKIHSIAYTASAVYFWGLNVGQINLPDADNPIEHRVNGILFKGRVVASPIEVPWRDEIKHVVTCETCTIVVTSANDMHLLYLGQRVRLGKIPARVNIESHFDAFKPSRMTEAPAIKKVVMKAPEHVAVLLENGDAVSFVVNTADVRSMKSLKYSTVWLAADTDMRAVDIDNSYDGSLLVCTRNGSVLIKLNQSLVSRRRGSSSQRVLPALSDSTNKKFKKLEGVNRVVRICCDDSFTSFGLIKDDIDSLPYKLQKNDFIKDMEYLGPLHEQDLYRKQDQLLDVDHDVNCYVLDYLFPSENESIVRSGEGSLFGILDNSHRSSELEDIDEKDALRDSLLKKHSSKRNKAPSVALLYQVDSLSEVCELEQKLAITNISTLFNDRLRGKFCDGIILLGQTNVKIGFHIKILKHRSAFFRRLIDTSVEGDYFKNNHLQGSYKRESKTLLFESKIEPLAALAFVHFVYTNCALRFWERNPQCNATIKKDFDALMTLFEMNDVQGKNERFLEQMQDMYADQQDNDVNIALADGETISCSSLIVSRSAFFETILSSRWETGELEPLDEGDSEMKEVGLSEITRIQMQIILKHLYGVSDLHVFDDAFSLVEETQDADDFVNFLLEMIEIADELLLVQLKHLCELAIKEFINCDNVLLILSHADWMKANKLFMSCCWHIYNNLQILLFDSTLRSLDLTILKRVEQQMRFFDKCKHPEFVIGDHGEVNPHVNSPTLPSLVETFISDLSAHNEVFMSDKRGFDSFEPLVDIKAADSQPSEGRRRLSARKMSRKGSSEAVAEIRKLVISAPGRRDTDSDSAVADEEFELVTRRRKSKTKITGSDADTSSEALVSEDVLRSDVRTSSVVDSEVRNVGGSSAAKSIARLVDAPVLGQSAEPEKKATRIKFAPRLSQKDRRKQLLPEPERTEQSEVTFSNPWKVNEDITGSRGSDRLRNLPVLGQKATSSSRESSLADIMAQDVAREAERREQPQRQTLQEIQQEQEFARWWEEECRRVQGASGVDKFERNDTSQSRPKGQRSGSGRGRGPKNKRTLMASGNSQNLMRTQAPGTQTSSGNQPY